MEVGVLVLVLKYVLECDGGGFGVVDDVGVESGFGVGVGIGVGG